MLPITATLLLLAGGPASSAAARSDVPAGWSGTDCVLHVWPSNNTAANRGGWLSNLGIAGAMVDYENNKDANLRDQVTLIRSLPPPVQAQILDESDLPALFGMQGARVVFEGQKIEPRSAARVRSRRSASSARCYAELIVSLNLLQKSAVYRRTLTTKLTFKDYRGDGLRMFSDRVRNSAHGFPDASLAEDVVAQRALAAAFSRNIRDFAAKVRRKMR